MFNNFSRIFIRKSYRSIGFTQEFFKGPLREFLWRLLSSNYSLDCCRHYSNDSLWYYCNYSSRKFSKASFRDSSLRFPGNVSTAFWIHYYKDYLRNSAQNSARHYLKVCFRRNSISSSRNWSKDSSRKSCMNFLREFNKPLQELFQVFQGYLQVFYWRFLRHVSKNFSRYQSWYFPEISWNIFFKFFNISIKNFFKYFFNNLKTLETIWSGFFSFLSCF